MTERDLPGELPAGALDAEETRATKLYEDPTKASPPVSASRKTAIFAGIAGVIVVAALGIGGWWIWGRGPSRQIESIAVLPFTNAGGNPDSEYLSDGLTEALIGVLSKLPDLSVRSRTSVFRYKGKEIDTRKTGEELGVQALLSGKVTQRGDEIDLTVELVDAFDDTVIWTERYSRKLTDVAALQNEIALSVSRQLRSTLSKGDSDLFDKKPTENSEAYLLYMRGRFQTAKFTREGLDRGLAYFNEAIEKDPTFASAYAGIAYYYITSADWFLTSKESLPKAKAAAEKALSIDPDNPEALGFLAIVKWWSDWDPPGAEAAFRRSLEIDPNNTHTRAFFGWFLVSTGRSEEGIRQNRDALKLDPLSVETNSLYGHSLYYGRKYDLAEEQLRKTIEIDSNYWLAHAILARSLYKMGRNGEAIKEARITFELEREVVEVRTLLAGILAGSGSTAEARKILAELEELGKTRFVPAYNLAEAYVGLGDNEKAIGYLEKAYEDRSFYLALLRTDPIFDGLRSEPRLKSLQEKTGL